MDTANSNYGSNIFRLNSDRPEGDYGYSLPSGPRTTGVNAQLLVSYELKENLYLEASALIRQWKAGFAGNVNTSVITAGIRMNMFRREYDY